MTDRPDLYGPDGYFAKFTAMCHAVRAAADKIKADKERRSTAYQRGYNDALRAQEAGDV